jgi:RNA polymerase sigma factor (sigma-70 family)
MHWVCPIIGGSGLDTGDKRVLVGELAVKQMTRLQGFLRRRVRNSADIPDIIQEVFLRLLRVPSHEVIRVPEAYIFTIARHVAQQHKLRSAAGEVTVELEEALAELRSGTEVDPVLQASAQQCLEGLNEVVERMPAKVQATFLMCRRDGMSMDEIGERLGISRPMAKKYLVKALVRLRKHLEETE